MLTFFGEPALKEAVRARVKAHQEADRIRQGHYWSRITQTGCFIGCSLQTGGDNGEELDNLFAERLGLPAWFGRFGEMLFELLPLEEAKRLPLALYDAVPVGANLEVLRREVDEEAEEFAVGVFEMDHKCRPDEVELARIRNELEGDAPYYYGTVEYGTVEYVEEDDLVPMVAELRDWFFAKLAEVKPEPGFESSLPTTAEFTAYYDDVKANPERLVAPTKAQR